MAVKNIAEEVNNRINEMLVDRRSDLNTISTREEEERAKLVTVEEEMKKAADEIDAEAYETAAAKKRRINTTLEMLRDKYCIIENQEYITEAESDKVVDALLEYEKDLEAEFKKAVADLLPKLAELYTDYMAAVIETEKTITRWTNSIHANYNTRGRSSRIDPATGERTYRSDKPCPVRIIPFDGCVEAHHLGSFLKKENII